MLPELIYTALGDSLTLGIGPNWSTGFVERYGEIIKSKYNLPVVTRIHAKRK